MARTQILDSSGSVVKPKEGASCNLTITLYDASGDALAKSSISTLTASLFNSEDLAIINSRNAQSVLDANGGTVSSAGVLTLKLQPADNIIVDSDTLDFERHYLDIKWTWTDSGGTDRTGIHEFYFDVEAVDTPVSSPTNPSSGWPA